MSSEHAVILATQWLTARQLEKAGIPCRKGPFDEHEIQNIHEAIRRYQTENKLTDEQVDDIIYSDTSGSGFWTHVAYAVPQRGVKSVFYHVRRARLEKAGKWDAAEDEQLLKAVQKHGTSWVAVGNVVRRSPADCSDRYRQHMRYKDTKRTGPWSPEEECRLLHAIEKLTKAGMAMSARGFWVSVSNALDGTRTPKQCRGKWSDTLQGKIGNEGKARWSKADSNILICKIACLDVDKEADIDWKSLTEPSWMWSSHSLQQRWKGLKASINTDGISHRNVINNLIARMSLDLTANTSAPPSSISSST